MITTNIFKSVAVVGNIDVQRELTQLYFDEHQISKMPRVVITILHLEEFEGNVVLDVKGHFQHQITTRQET